MKKFMSVLTAVAVAAAFTTVALAADQGAAKTEKAAKPDKPKRAQFTGEITALDAAANSLTVKHSTKDESKTFKTDARTKVATADKEDATLADLKVGDKVVVMADDAGLAKSIKPHVKKDAAPKDEKKEGKKEAKE
jgi:Cu/Ag efflux protein CusF